MNLPAAVESEQIEEFLASGRYFFGANYWASHAGPQMWKQWNRDIVEKDFSILAAHGIKTLRVFPLWPDFQPICCLRSSHGQPTEIRFGEEPLPHDEVGQAGVSRDMLNRLEIVADLADKQGIGLIIGLITGWMSGRLFVPPALEGLNPITDATSVMWQLRLVKTIVKRLRHHASLRAWDLGNECNVMGPATSQQAWLWTSALAHTIRSHDPSHPVISGMHSLAVDPRLPWAISAQGELTDVLTTHPYPLFTPYCNQEPMDNIRPLLHSTAETCLYADLSGKPAFVEEIGNFGPYFCDEKIGARIVKTIQASTWAHNARAALWWCAFDQSSLEEAPHDWVALERDLGLFREDRSPKPLVSEIGSFQTMLKHLPFSSLPPRLVDAVCILTRGQDQWGAAYSTFILAKQAGFDIQFAFADNPLPESNFYLLPSLGGLTALSRRRELELDERVKNGATLYVSADDGFVRETFAMTGLDFLGRCTSTTPREFKFAGEKFSIPSSTRFNLRAGRAAVLAEDEEGCPVFSSATHGLGKVYFMALPLEASVARRNGAFLSENTFPYWKIYQHMIREQKSRRLLRKNSPFLGVTEHHLNPKDSVAVIINYSPNPVSDILTLSQDVGIDVLHGETPHLTSLPDIPICLEPNDYTVWHLQTSHEFGNS